MEYIVLGLLLLRPRTIYELRKRINEGLELMYSCSTGSIQAALRKLLGRGRIVFGETVEKGKIKKVYSITDEGKKSFDAWVNGPIEHIAAKNPELVKLYFMGFSDKDNALKIIDGYIVELRKKLCVLEKICAEGETVLAERKNDIAFYQFQTALYGRDFMRFNIKWYNELEERIKGEL